MGADQSCLDQTALPVHGRVECKWMRPLVHNALLCSPLAR